MADEPRRYLIAAGVETYVAPDWLDLPDVKQEVDCIVGLLTGTDFGLQRVLETESRRPDASFMTALSTWVKATDRQPDDHLVLYWSGHGDVENGRLRLLLSSTTDIISDALELDKLVDVLLQSAARIGPILLLLDVCFAGHATFDIGQRLEAISRERPAQAAPNLSAMWAAGPRDEANPLAFVGAFAEAVVECLDPGEHRFPALELDRIARQVELGLHKRGQVPGGSWHSGRGPRNFLRNPYHLAHWPEGIDVATAQFFRTLDPVARGVSGIGEAGWFFKGRCQVFADLCGWLKDASKPGLCRVSGDPGAGKSAVLSRLYLLSRKDYRRRLPPDALNETELPPQDAIDAMVLLAHRTVPDVFGAIARGLRAAASTPDELEAELSGRDRCPVLVADGLDEAVAPKATRDLLEKLASTTVRVILGSRRPTLKGAARADLDIDLDVEPWADHAAVQRYVAHRLAIVSPARWSAGELADTAHRIAQPANGNFLVARLSALAPGAPGSPEQEFPATVGEGLDRILATLGDEEASVRALLLPLCYAEGGGLPRGPLWVAIANDLIGGGITEADLDTLFRLAGHFVVEDLQEEGCVYRPFHAALADHLRRGTPARLVHAAFVEALRELLESHATAGAAEVNYARRTLARHLRLAGRWQDLARLIAEPAWIARQYGRPPLDPGQYRHDVGEAQAAAHAANLAALAAGRPPPALAMNAWCLIWRSAVVSQVAELAPSAWPLAVRIGTVSPAAALAAVLSIGDANARAIRLAALARVFRGGDLDLLLDYAEGVKVDSAAGPPQGHAEEVRGAQSAELPKKDPEGSYEYILSAALAGPDPARPLERALAAAALKQDYPRWLLLKSLLPHLDDARLAAVGNLIEPMQPNGRSAWWRALALAAWLKERARRGDPKALPEAMALPPDSLAWWFTLAALFSLGREGVLVVPADLTPADALCRAEAEVDDWLHRLEVVTAFACALPNRMAAPDRAALARYLRLVHATHGWNARLRLAAEAGERLPQPHGRRLLRWARARLENCSGSERDNINHFFTPPALAVALARSGDLAGALAMLARTNRHDFFWPKAVMDLVAALPASAEDHADTFARLMTWEDGERLQLLSAAYDLLHPTQRKEVVDRIDAHRSTLSRDIAALRCRVGAALARHGRLGQLDHRSLLALAESMSDQYARHRVLEALASGWAASGQVDWAVAAIAAASEHAWRDNLWANVLTAACEAALAPLLQSLAGDRELWHTLEGFSVQRAVAIRAVTGPVEFVQLIGDITPSDGYFGDNHSKLLAAAAFRAFELGEADLARRLVAQCRDLASVAAACRRLPIERRRQYLALAREAKPDGWTARAILSADVLIGKRVRSTELARMLHDDNTWLLGFLPSETQRRVAAVRFRDLMRDDDIRSLRMYSWMMDWLDSEQIDGVLSLADKADDSYYRDEAILALLPRYAELRGAEEAVRLCGKIRRSTHLPIAWAKLWPWLSLVQRNRLFAEIVTPERPDSLPEARALGEIAALLEPDQLRQATAWIVAHFAADQVERLRPLVEAACRLRPRDAYLIWDCVVTGSMRDTRVDAVARLYEVLPLTEHLGGVDALEALAGSLARLTEQWP